MRQLRSARCRAQPVAGFRASSAEVKWPSNSENVTGFLVMTVPGFTADACMQLARTRMGAASSNAGDASDRIVLQGCITDDLAACSLFLGPCFYAGGCWFARAFGGPEACTRCMSACLSSPLNPISAALAWLCIPCASPGGCMIPGPCFNICR
jgi:hypothetical protein